MIKGQRPGWADEAERRKIMELMKWELARELGISPPADGYWGGLPSKLCGQIGARLRARVRALAQAQGEGQRPVERD
ncbi:MAG: small, acid-soluble spore protein, alpha/beta type [Alicyclobacillaceae bacterium]|nr:small, acid-soluble spore protein, alpha/beta type [Alicyclobacillaceae bacterium]